MECLAPAGVAHGMPCERDCRPRSRLPKQQALPPLQCKAVKFGAPATSPRRLMLDGVPVGAVRAQLDIDVPDTYLQSPLQEVRS